MRAIDVEGSYNVRDLGGYSTLKGTQIKYHMFVRAGNLDKLPASSQQQLIDYGITTIIDLRDEWEVENFPNVFANSPHMIYRNLPLIGDAISNDKAWQTESENYGYLHELYIKYLENCKSQIGDIFTALSESKGTALFHCYAGKDRTGIVAGLLLSALGVADDDIARDYSLSRQEITHLVDEWRAYALEHDKDMVKLARDVASNAETMLEMLKYLRENYGSTLEYLQSCGVADSALIRLQTMGLINL